MGVSMNLWKPVLNVSILLSQLEEDKENRLLVIDRPEKPLLLLTQSSTKEKISMVHKNIKNFTVSTLLLVKNVLLLLTLFKILKNTMHWNIQLLLLPPLQKLPHFSSWPHTLVALLVNT